MARALIRSEARPRRPSAAQLSLYTYCYNSLELNRTSNAFGKAPYFLIYLAHRKMPRP